MATTTMDSADEAGGEAVFTSDGLPSLAGPLPPPPLPFVGGSGGDEKGGGDAVIEEDGSDPRAAFDSFVGDAAGASVGYWTARPSSAADGAWEDPRRRLLRLKSEVDSLEAALAEESRKEDDDGDLRAAASELKSRLDALGLADSSSLAEMLRGRQEDLSRVIARDLERFGDFEGGGDLSKGMEDLSLKGEAKEGEGGGDGKRIVYELYRSGGAASSTGTVPREVALEERLRRLEVLVGSTSGGGGEKSVLERVEEAERLAGEADAKRIEKLAAKAKVVRADLEAAARARAKLASKSNNNNAGGSKEDAATIAELHSQMAELEGVSAHLPALAARLAELSELHSNAAEFAARLDAAEAAAGRAEGALASVEEALGRMEGGWKDNLEGVERNVKRLDELLAKQSS